MDITLSITIHYKQYLLLIMGDDFFSSDSESAPEEAAINNHKKDGKKGKHAPKEASSRKHVSMIREIPGLETKKNLYRDIRFDAAYGDVDYDKVRQHYQFLDQYRDNEIKKMDNMLNDKKLLSRMDEDDIESLRYKDQSLKSRMGHLKQQKRDKDAISQYKRETGKKWLKHSETRKVIRVAKFESMNGKQRRKAIERRRKRKLGKEMRSFAFSKE